MTALVIGLLLALTITMGLLYWLLLVEPEQLLSLLPAEPGQETWFEDHPRLLLALRWAGGTVLLLLAFLSGLATAFLAGTGALDGG